MNDRDQCYRALDWSLSVTEAVNQAYKDLAFIWHPDRIPKDNSSATESAREIEGD